MHHEQLEPRRLLTVFIVDTTIDGPGMGDSDGVISLREAVVASNTNAAFGDAPAGSASVDVIQFHEDIEGQSILIDSSQGALEITGAMEMNVGGPHVTLARGGGEIRIFDVNTDQAVVFANVTMTGGRIDNQGGGGGLLLRGGGQTTLDGVSIINNVTFDGPGGGGIFNVDHDLTIRNSTISGNGADNELLTSSGGDTLGGGLLSLAGALTITDSVFENNFSEGAGGGIHVGAPEATIARTVIRNNEVDPDPNVPNVGGGLSVAAGSTVSVDASTISGNRAGDLGGAAWVGEGATLNIGGDSDVVGNRSQGNGGGIYNDGGIVTFDFSDLFDNKAIFGENANGGGIYSDGGSVTVSSSKVLRNTSSFDGGAIFMNGGELTLFMSEFSDNFTGVIELPQGPGRQLGNGGGLYLTNGAVAEIESSRIQRNVASRLGDGGGIWMDAGTTVSINMTLIADNDASRSGGGVFNDGGSLTFSRSRAWGNAAGSAVGDTDDETDNDPNGDGGGIYVGAGGSADVSISSIARNRAPRHGGGIFNDAELAVTFTAINDNFAGDDGGGIFNDDDADANLIDAFLFRNVPNDIA